MNLPRASKSFSKIETNEPKNLKTRNKTKKKARARKSKRRKKSLSQASVSGHAELTPDLEEESAKEEHKEGP
jgi:hypothetical protein